MTTLPKSIDKFNTIPMGDTAGPREEKGQARRQEPEDFTRRV